MALLHVCFHRENAVMQNRYSFKQTLTEKYNFILANKKKERRQKIVEISGFFLFFFFDI